MKIILRIVVLVFIVSGCTPVVNSPVVVGEALSIPVETRVAPEALVLEEVR